MASQHRFEERFVYVQQGERPWVEYAHYRGIGDEAEREARETAAVLFGRGDRVQITNKPINPNLG